MSEIASERVGPMLNPPHLGELIRESMDDAGWNVTQTAARLGCERGTLSRLLNGKAGVSANMALALEDVGLGRRRSLDADAGELRACAGASGEGCGRTERRGAALVSEPLPWRRTGARTGVVILERSPLLWRHRVLFDNRLPKARDVAGRFRFRTLPQPRRFPAGKPAWPLMR